ncbi:Pleiotropic drug resistance protein 3 [Phytophthora cinnamomi]|uniref:Pleiotropic drug resistance protein 3 n=1 Tax=Phytophthora cinnamomi TaxID=4785 RepID=UPI00355A0A4F|nr:Pleiotropic drug resistance protein 3 [Phytophthora cinnamomi]
MNKNVSIEGGISYNGLDWKDLLPKLPQLATYVPQSDTHFPSLTVKETLGFAHACCGDPMPMSFEREQESLPQIRYLDVIIEQLGLKTCQDTRIGDDLIRGISGGERRRVTTGEMLFGPWKYATFMDEVTTGLDSATAFDIVSSQRDFAKKLQQTVVMALLQPTPEVFELFDNVLLLNNALLTNLNMAEPLSMFSIIFYSAFAGFVVPMARIPWFFSWLYWINPLAWCLRSVAVSQYRSPTFSVCVYDGEDYCEQFNKTIGEYLLSEYDVPSSTEWVWAGVVYLVFANIFFIAVTSVILESHRHDVPQFCKSMVEGKLSSHKTNQGQSTENEVANYVMISTPRVGSGLPGPEKDAGAVMVSIHEHGAFVPVTLAFKNLSYSTHIKHKSVELLKDVSGYALPGTMTALMGSSGAGKTTLLDVIAGRKTEGDVRGEIFLNGYPATKQTIQRCTGYCEQQGIHSEGSTIREALTFSAILRQERGVSVQAKLAAVEECLDLLGLRSIADLIIRGRTQEQLKRLTIGVELAAQSSVLFLDEPTSGLDAHASKIVMDAVRKVANSGRTIVCTIHQPSSDIFCLFDSLLLLKQGGEMVYFGALHATPTNQCVGEHLIDYFQAIPGVPRISEGRNSATWMLECIGAGIDVSEGDRVTRDIDFVHHFRNSEDRLTLLREINRPGVGEAAPDLFREIVFHHTRAASSWTQLWSVTLRFFTIYWRTPSYNLTRLIIALSLGLVFGLLLVAEDFTTYQGMNSAVGVIFMTTLYQGNISFVGVLPFTAQERASYYRERNSQTYSVVWYFVGSTLVEIPYAFASGLIFSVVFYPMLGFTTLYTALLYWITVSLFVLVETYLGQFLVYALPTVELAAIVGVLLNSFFLLFSGFNPPVASIPDMYRWCYYISPHHYALSILVSLAFGNCPNKVTYDKATKLFVNTGSPIGCQPLENSPLSLGSVTIQEYIGQVYNMEYGDIWSNFGCIVACIVILRVLSLLAMRYLNHHKR